MNGNGATSGQNASRVGGDIAAGPQEIVGGDGVQRNGLSSTVIIAIAAGSGALALVLVVLCIFCCRRRRRRRRKQAELGGAAGLQMNPAAPANGMARSAPDGGGESAWNTDTYALEDRVPPGQAWMENNLSAVTTYATADEPRPPSSYDIIDNGRHLGAYDAVDDPHTARTYDVIENSCHAELYATREALYETIDTHVGPVYDPHRTRELLGADTLRGSARS